MCFCGFDILSVIQEMSMGDWPKYLYNIADNMFLQYHLRNFVIYQVKPGKEEFGYDNIGRNKNIM